MQHLTLIKNKKQTGNYIFNACIEFECTKKKLEKKIKQQTAKSKQ